MKYLVLFELGKKRFVESFSTRNNAVDAINSYTKLADDVIISIIETGKDKYGVEFIDGSKATVKIQKNKDESLLGYYPADLQRIFEKIKSILTNKQNEQAKSLKRARIEALVITLAGVGIFLGGFALAVVALSPSGVLWQFIAMGSSIMLGLATTIRGTILMTRPNTENKQYKLAKQNA